MGGTCNIKEPDSLKACLQLFAKLSDSDVKSKVLEALKTQIKGYCDSTYLSSSLDGCLMTTFEYTDTLLKRILPSSFEITVDYGPYKDLCTLEISHPDCVETIANFVSKSCFKIFTALCLLNFNTEKSSSRGIKGGGWGSDTLSRSDSSLVQWLKDEIPKPQTSHSTDVDCTGILRRGFGDNAFASSSANEISIELKNLVDHTTGGSLGKALGGLLLLGSWDHSKLGYACLFLHYFCKELEVGGKLKGKYETIFDLKSEYSDVKQNINPFVVGREDKSGAYAVCLQNDKLYDNLFTVNGFNQYICWMFKCIPNIIVSLQTMSEECANWNEANLKSAKSGGPFKYGFVFKDDKWDDVSFKGKVTRTCSELVVSLRRLLKGLLNTFQTPSTIKELIQFLGALCHTNNMIVKCEVFQQLKVRIENYLDYTYTSGFIDSESNLSLSLRNAKSLLNTLFIKADEFSMYGHYSNLSYSSDCVEKYVDIFVHKLFPFFAALSFLYFNVSEDCRNIKGGGWSNQRLNPGQSNANNKHLNLWLTAKTSSLWTPGGFTSEDFRSSSASMLATKLKDLVHHTSAASLQKALEPVLFLGLWYDSKLGHSVLFLREFCSRVESMGSQYSQLGVSISYSTLQPLCKSLKENLNLLVTGTDGIKIRAVCQSIRNLYGTIFGTGKVDYSKFQVYLKWIKQNLTSIIGSLKQMLSDSSNWNETSLKEGDTAGPFKYGFVFTSQWDEKQLFQLLKNAVEKLTGVLQCLLIALMQPSSLKECLQHFAHLHTMKTLKHKVISAITTSVKNYCGDTYFCNISETDEALFWILQSADWILTTLLGNNKYGDYAYIQDSEETPECCIRTFADTVIAKLLEYYITLYLLYFHTSTECGINGGASWSQMRINDTNKKLNQWLKDEHSIENSGLMKRGFQGKELSGSACGSTLAGQMKNLLDITAGAHLQKFLLGMMFVLDWSHAIIGNAVAFLWELCSIVEAGGLTSELSRLYPSGNTECMKIAFSTLSKDIAGLNSVLSPTCRETKGLFSQIRGSSSIESESLEKYLKWFKQNIEGLESALQCMKKDCTKWNKESLTDGTSAGPFKFGFVFTNDKWHASIRKTLPDAISRVIVSLRTLSYFLDPAFNALTSIIAKGSGALGGAMLKTAFDGLKKVETKVWKVKDEEHTGQGPADASITKHGSQSSEEDPDGNSTEAQTESEEGLDYQATESGQDSEGSQQAGELSNIQNYASSDGDGSAGEGSTHDPSSDEVDKPDATVQSARDLATPNAVCKFTPPSSLKGCLQILAKLYNQNTLKSHVLGDIKIRLEQYCGSEYMGKFTQEGSGYLGKVFEYADGLLRAIIGDNDATNMYGDYSQICSSIHPECVQEYSGTIIARLPQCYAALFYLYYNSSNNLESIKGGSWNNMQLKDGQILQTWLVSSSSDFMSTGFSYRELSNSSSGAGIERALKGTEEQVTGAFGTNQAGVLQKVLAPMLFVCSWERGLTAHACLFVYELCKQVNENENGLKKRFDGDYSKLKEICVEIKEELDTSFVSSSTDGLGAVCQDNCNLYSDIWDDDKFEDYIEWVQQNLFSIILSLQTMSEECANWNETNLKSAKSGGPFKYGFVFKDGSWTDESFKGTLRNSIESLTNSPSGPLQKLFSVLKSLTAEDTEDSSNATIIATVGGTVVGAAGLGVAYAYNIWGFATLIQSVLAPLL